jgi:hypothetical protein
MGLILIIAVLSLLIWIVVAFLVGYEMGRLGYQPIPEVTKRAKKAFDRSPVGLVRRPTAKQLFYRKNPKLKEEELEMKKAFERIKNENQ